MKKRRANERPNHPIAIQLPKNFLDFITLLFLSHSKSKWSLAYMPFTHIFALHCLSLSLCQTNKIYSKHYTVQLTTLTSCIIAARVYSIRLMYALYLYQYCQAETVQVLQYILIHDNSRWFMKPLERNVYGVLNCNPWQSCEAIPPSGIKTCQNCTLQKDLRPCPSFLLKTVKWAS